MIGASPLYLACPKTDWLWGTLFYAGLPTVTLVN